MTAAYVGLGSNRDRERNLRASLAALATEFGSISRSPVYASASASGTGDDYFNCVVGFSTALSARSLVETLKRIETARGRERCEHVVTIDLDLLLYGEEIIDAADFCVPHPDIMRYAFVLRPLADIAPEYIHPKAGSTLPALLDALGAEPPLTDVSARFADLPRTMVSA